MRRAAVTAATALATFSVAAVAAGLGRGVLTSYLPVALDRIRDAPGLIGTVMLVNVASGFVVPLWVGLWSDRLRGRGHGRTLPFIFGGALLAAGGLVAVALGTGTTYLLLALCAAVAYTGMNAVTTAHRALIVDVFTEEERPEATGAQELATLIGGTLGVAAGGVLVEWRTWAPFAAAALAVPLLSAPTVLRMRGREPAAAAAAADRPARAPLRYYLRIARRPGVRTVLMAQGLWVLAYAALPSFFVLYAERALDLRPAIAGALLVAFGALSGATMLLAGMEKRPERHVPLLAIGIVLLGCGLLAMFPGDDALEVAPGLVAAAIGFGILSTLGFPVMSSFIPPGEEGAYTAVFFSERAIAGAIALPAAGWTIAATDSYRSLLAFGGVAALAALVPVAALGGWSARAWLAGLQRPRLPAPGALGLIAAGVAGATALALAGGLLVAGTGLAEIDGAVFHVLNGVGRGPEFLDVEIVSADLRNYVLLVVATFAGALFWRRGQTLRSLALVVLAGVISFAMVRILWVVWDRARPQEVLDDVAVVNHDWTPYPSFPSGHVAVWTAMALAMATLFPRLRIPLLALVALVAVTRVVYGAHFPSDVLFAALVGCAAAVAARAIMRATGLLEQPPRDVVRRQRPGLRVPWRRVSPR